MKCLCALAVLFTATRAISAGDQPIKIVPEDAKLEQLWNAGTFTEGVAVAPDGTIYFSDITADETPGRVLRFVPETGKTEVASAHSGKSNGLMFNRQGVLIAACGAAYGKRCLAKIVDGQVKVLVDKYKGKKFNAPNDLVIHPNGTIYFSDPFYVGTEKLELDHMSVYRYDPRKTANPLTQVTENISRPNGVILSPDSKTLYVAETDPGSEEPDAKKPIRMTLNAFPINADGSLGKKRVLVNFGKKLGVDGMTVDQLGNIYASVRSADRFGITVYNPEGQELAYIKTPDLPTNCTFGIGDDANMLYITAGKGLYRIRLTQTGYHPAIAK